MILILRRFRRGGSRGIFKGSSLETSSKGGQLKKTPCSRDGGGHLRIDYDDDVGQSRVEKQLVGLPTVKLNSSL